MDGKYRSGNGLLDSIPHIKPVSVIVVSKGNADKLIQFVKDYSTELFVRDVILLPEDEAILSRAVSISIFVPKFNYGADINDQT
jgi:hypothetical protein